jgi:hypothetical protein
VKISDQPDSDAWRINQVRALDPPQVFITNLNSSDEIELRDPKIFKISQFIDPWVHANIWSDQNLSLTIRLENLSDMK